jgi:hypothetical protein
MRAPGGTRRRAVVAACTIVAAAASGAAGALAAGHAGWAWFEGDSVASIGQPAGTSDLVLEAKGSLNFLAGHLRLMSQSGTFALVHGPGSSRATLVAFDLGTAHRTPIQIGAPTGNAVTPLVVAGSGRQRSDLERWTVPGKTVAAIDAQGRLRLGAITIYPVLRRGRVVLLARLPDGSVQVLGPPR